MTEFDMGSPERWVALLCLFLLGMSFGATAVLGLRALFGVKVPERFYWAWIRVHSTVQFALTLAAFCLFEILGLAPIHIRLPAWYSVGSYHFESGLLINSLSLVYALLVTAISGIIFRFSLSYLHREPGLDRFFGITSAMVSGLLAISLGGSFDEVLIGWEIVGVSSVLLISFFRANVRSVTNSFRALVYYRLCDISLICASAMMHHSFHSNDFHDLQHLRIHAPSLLGGLIILGTLAKSAQLPMTPWLPRAMEGPTPSSAIFYGALSVHLGPFLLLRTQELWEPYPLLRAMLALIGLSTAFYSTVVGRTRYDVKTGLGYGTVAQIGVIYVELALGWDRFALLHLCGHALMRTWQFLRSSSLLHDFQENPRVYQGYRARDAALEVFLPVDFRKRFFILAFQGFFLDQIQLRYFAEEFLSCFDKLNQWEVRLGRWLHRRWNELFHGGFRA